MTSVNQYMEFSNGNRMPIVGMGTARSTGEELEQLIDNALKVGYKLIDTAFLYQNEADIGKALSKHFASGLKREDIFITSKLPMHGMRKDLVKHFLELSLKDLQLEYVDLYLVHYPVGSQYTDDKTAVSKDESGVMLWDMKTDLLEVWKGMEEVCRLGLAKSIGLSNFNQEQIQRILKNCEIKPVNLQTECHLYLQEEELTDFCRSEGIVVTCYGPLSSPAIVELEKQLGLSTSENPSPLQDPLIISLSEKYKRTPGQILLRWLTQRKLAIIPKSTNPIRMKNNLEIFDFEIDADDMKQLSGLNKNIRIFSMVNFFPGIETHPEYPFKKSG